jgi:hypothetical protein
MTSSRGTDGKNSCSLTCGDLSHPVPSPEGLIFCPTLPSSVVFTQLNSSFPAKFMNIFALSFCAYDHLFPSLPHPPSLSLLSLPPSLSLPLYALPTLSPSLLLPQSLTLSASHSLSPPLPTSLYLLSLHLYRGCMALEEVDEALEDSLLDPAASGGLFVRYARHTPYTIYLDITLFSSLFLSVFLSFSHSLYPP